MISNNIKFENFKGGKIQNNLKFLFKDLINKRNDKKNLINSFTKSYVYSYDKKQLKKYKKFSSYQIFGMGGSSLGIQAIYDFFKFRIKKISFF